MTYWRSGIENCKLTVAMSNISGSRNGSLFNIVLHPIDGIFTRLPNKN
jgi:hypothetical protein